MRDRKSINIIPASSDDPWWVFFNRFYFSNLLSLKGIMKEGGERDDMKNSSVCTRVSECVRLCVTKMDRNGGGQRGRCERATREVKSRVKEIRKLISTRTDSH